jgi:hypothetical protein
MTKSDPCPECGVWTESGNESPCLLVCYPSKWDMITKAECKTCEERHRDCMIELGRKHRRKMNEMFWAAFHANAQKQERQDAETSIELPSKRPELHFMQAELLTTEKPGITMFQRFYISVIASLVAWAVLVGICKWTLPLLN